MSTSSVNHVNKPIYEQVIFERRILCAFTGLCGVCVLVWLLAISTDHWAYINGGQGIYIPSTRRFFVHSHTGLWRICRDVLVPQTVAATLPPTSTPQPENTTDTSELDLLDESTEASMRIKRQVTPPPSAIPRSK